jgi:hypothetical protein
MSVTYWLPVTQKHQKVTEGNREINTRLLRNIKYFTWLGKR